MMENGYEEGCIRGAKKQSAEFLVQLTRCTTAASLAPRGRPRYRRGALRHAATRSVRTQPVHGEAPVLVVNFIFEIFLILARLRRLLLHRISLHLGQALLRVEETPRHEFAPHPLYP